MKKMILIAALGLFFVTGQCQTILQLTEQLALDAQKLASLKSTLQEMVQGYDKLKTGYTRIRDIARDNFNLHKGFLDRMLVLSQEVRGDPRMGAILQTANRVVTEYRSQTMRMGNNPLFTPQEIGYITGTLSALLARCNRALEELSLVTTDNELRMSDDERLTALDRIDGEVRSDLVFLQQFDKALSIEAARRQKESGDIQTLKKLYGLPD